jgi:hypothetical protein
MNKLSVCALTRPLHAMGRGSLRVRKTPRAILGVRSMKKGEPETV